MGQKHEYVTKADLEGLVLRMREAGILYDEALQEFKRQFILVALRAARWNQSRAAEALGMHRNTLVRALRALGIDVRSLRGTERRPPQRAAGPPPRQKILG